MWLNYQSAFYLRSFLDEFIKVTMFCDDVQTNKTSNHLENHYVNVTLLGLSNGCMLAKIARLLI